MLSQAQVQTMAYSLSPSAFDEAQTVTITVEGSSINEGAWVVSNNELFIWAWSYDDNLQNERDCPTNGSWGASSVQNRFTYNAATDRYTFTLTPNVFFNRTGMGRFGFLVKPKDGSGEKKTQDVLINVGAFQVTMVQPLENSTTILTNGGSLLISATNSNGLANYTLRANGTVLTSANAVNQLSYTHTNITANQRYELTVVQGTKTQVKIFDALVEPTAVLAAAPANLEDGVNYGSDASKVTLKLNVPGKDYVYVAGSFNNYQPDTRYAMKKDPFTGIFWLEITGLTPGQPYNYQYWVVDKTPLTNCPVLVKSADMYSEELLVPYDDPGIPASTYPNLPAYPVGQTREVSVFQTNKPAYQWSTNNFVTPNPDKLVIYEVLVRDFAEGRNFQSLIDKISYFKKLKVNAIELLPVMEFEGNSSWGYNTSYHLAVDKAYGPENKLKEFIDSCHKNGIAVILDVALNHATSRNPGVRMWMEDADNDGWPDKPASDNPFFNQRAAHTIVEYFTDFNHQSSLTQYYTRRVIKRWIEDFKIDGFRWDFTLGFTQNCTGNEGCTLSYQQDRVDVLKSYADYSWSLDPKHIAIFEHVGDHRAEEQAWGNYRLNEGKGILIWEEVWTNYKELAQGRIGDIRSMLSSTNGLSGKRTLGYAESHDKDHVLYEAMEFGVTTTNSTCKSPRGNLNNALDRMAAIGAGSILIPGPKMIWHYQELGYQRTFNTCSDGSINPPGEGPSNPPGDCKLDEKPLYPWTENWLSDAQRERLFDTYSKLIEMKIKLPVFNGNVALNSEDGNDNNFKKRIFIWDDAVPTDSLKNIVILLNYSICPQQVRADFPFAGTWYNMMDNTRKTVTNTGELVTVPPGGFLIYGNQPNRLLFQDTSIVPPPPPPPADTTYFTVAGNPIKDGVIRLKYKLNNTSKAEFYVFNSAGQHVKSYTLSLNENTAALPLHQPAGMYFGVLMTSSEKRTVKLLVQ